MTRTSPSWRILVAVVSTTLEHRKHVFWLAVIVLSLGMPAIVKAQPTIPGGTSVCVEEEIDFENPPVINGCEIRDCCPGCPGPPHSLDWHISLESELKAVVTFEFENLSPEQAERLRIQGNAEWVDDFTLQVGTGETILSGFIADPNGKPIVAIPQIIVDQADIQRRLEETDEDVGRAQEEVGSLTFSVEQMLGPVEVNGIKTKYVLVTCPEPSLPPRPQRDEIDLNSNNTDDNAVILLDGRRDFLLQGPRCVDDEVWRGNDIIDVSSMLSPSTCHSDIIVFSDDDSMVLWELSSWADPLGDYRPFVLFDLLRPKVATWIMYGEPKEDPTDIEPFFKTLAKAGTNLARASQLYNTMNCGIGFQVATITDATQHPDTTNLLDATCSEASDLRAKIGSAPDALNIYYVRNSGGARGWWCGDNTIIMAAIADNETLAHEFGHAFSLGHTNAIDLNGDGVADFSGTNVMWGGGVLRNIITEGQCFRCNANQDSFLNSNGIRSNTLPIRDCSDTVIRSDCPALSLDIIPN